MSLPYWLRRALARLGLVAKPAVPTAPGGPHLATLASAVRLAAQREKQAGSMSGYVAALQAAAKLLNELSRAATAGDGRS